LQSRNQCSEKMFLVEQHRVGGAMFRSVPLARHLGASVSFPFDSSSAFRRSKSEVSSMREFDFCESQKHLNPVTMDFEAKPRARDSKGIAKSSSGGRFDRRRGNLSPGGSTSYWFWEDLKTGRGALTSCLSDSGRNFGRRSFSWNTGCSSGGERVSLDQKLVAESVIRVACGRPG